MFKNYPSKSNYQRTMNAFDMYYVRNVNSLQIKLILLQNFRTQVNIMEYLQSLGTKKDILFIYFIIYFDSFCYKILNKFVVPYEFDKKINYTYEQNDRKNNVYVDWCVCRQLCTLQSINCRYFSYRLYWVIQF